MTALQDRGAGVVTGEKSMKHFINLRVKSSKTAMEIHIGTNLVKQLVVKKLISRFNGSVFSPGLQQQLTGTEGHSHCSAQ